MMSKENPVASLSPEELYGEQIRFFAQAGLDGEAVQRQLSKTRAVVIGGGVVGSLTLSLLAEAGVGMLRILDATRTEARTLPGNALLRAEDVGRPRAEALSERLRQRHPSLTSESVPANPLSASELAPVLRDTDCAVVCLDSPAPALLDAVNAAALQAQTRWLMGQVYSGVGLVGPTVIPDQSPCYKCYELRRNANLSNYEETVQYESRLRQMPGIRSECVAPRPLAALLSAFLALEVQRLLTGVSTPQTVGRILRLDFFATDMTSHQILRFPNCPACGYGKQRKLPLVSQLPPRA